VTTTIFVKEITNTEIDLLFELNKINLFDKGIVNIKSNNSSKK
jgi:hypothetical protein